MNSGGFIKRGRETRNNKHMFPVSCHKMPCTRGTLAARMPSPEVGPCPWASRMMSPNKPSSFYNSPSLWWCVIGSRKQTNTDSHLTLLSPHFSCCSHPTTGVPSSPHSGSDSPQGHLAQSVGHLPPSPMRCLFCSALGLV